MTVPVTTPAQSPRAAEQSSALGWLPWTFLAVAAGLMAASGADALSRTGHNGGSPLFWLALALMIIPAAFRLCGARARPGERIATVVVVGMGLYAVKILRDPFGFTYGDEFAHLHNLQSILASGRLFGANSILPITPRYPGLEMLAALIARVGGMSPFAAGVTTVAVGRLLIMLALYVLYARLSGSERAAGVGALLYAATPNFLFWSAQFAYESLALPLAVVALFVTIRWAQERRPGMRWPWELAFAVVAAAVVVTHHVSSYVLVAFLFAVCLIHWRLHGRAGAPWLLAAGSAVLTIIWLALAAGGTVGYLSPVLTSALKQVIQTLARETPTRTLFANQGGEVTPPAEIIAAMSGIILLGLGLLIGVRLVWQQRWRNPLMVLLVLCGFVYIGTLPLRFVPAAWETVSRAGDFLFVGVGLTVALGIVWMLERGRNRHPVRRRLAFAAAIMIVFASGVIAGWPANERLAQPRRVTVGGHTLDPTAAVAAQWSGRTLGAAQRVFAQDADARYFLTDAMQPSFTGDFAPDVDYLLNAPTLTPGIRSMLRGYGVTLVVSDRRAISSDNLFGFFLDVGPPSLTPAVPALKFDTRGANVLYDAGDLMIYGVRGLW
ncbi:MAG: glycosyltransferase family 39 protein [Solirubrobacteraceae bacterium]